MTAPGTLYVQWCDGMPTTGRADDEARALTAAHASLARDGFTPAEVASAYMVSVFGGTAPNATAALAWERASDAANTAATEGWHNPDGAHVEIVCPEVHQ